MQFVLKAKDIGKRDVKKVGGKGAHLAELINAGFPVPEAFFITIDAYEKFLEFNELKEKILKIIKKIDYSDINSLNSVSEEMKNLILKGKMPSEIRNHIIVSYKKLYGAPEMMRVCLNLLKIVGPPSTPQELFTIGINITNLKTLRLGL